MLWFLVKLGSFRRTNYHQLVIGVQWVCDRHRAPTGARAHPLFTFC